jgi:hypothetical protein
MNKNSINQLFNYPLYVSSNKQNDKSNLYNQYFSFNKVLNYNSITEKLNNSINTSIPIITNSSIDRKNNHTSISALYLNSINKYKQNAITIINNIFSYLQCINSEPIFTITNNKLIIYIFYYQKSNLSNKKGSNNSIKLRNKKYNRKNILSNFNSVNNTVSKLVYFYNTLDLTILPSSYLWLIHIPKVKNDTNHKNFSSLSTANKRNIILNNIMFKLNWIRKNTLRSRINSFNMGSSLLNNKKIRSLGSITEKYNLKTSYNYVILLQTLNTINKLNKLENKFKVLANILSLLFKVKVELNCIPLKYPYLDSSILAKFINLNTNKYKFDKIVRVLFRKASIVPKKLLLHSDNELLSSNLLLNKENNVPISKKAEMMKKISMKKGSVLTGIKIKIAGRLTTQRVIPKKTVKTDYKGSFINSKNNLVQNTSFTTKNKNGVYTINTLVSHNILP